MELSVSERNEIDRLNRKLTRFEKGHQLLTLVTPFALGVARGVGHGRPELEVANAFFAPFVGWATGVVDDSVCMRERRGAHDRQIIEKPILTVPWMVAMYGAGVGIGAAGQVGYNVLKYVFS